MRILMLGNSFIFTNHMPQMLADLTGAEVIHHTRGGARLSEQLNPCTKLGSQTQAALQKEKWDYVVLQEMSHGPITAPKSFFVNHRRVPSREDILNVSGDFANDLSRPLIFFISLQDLKGRSADAAGFKQKNQWIFDLPGGWDLLIIDESHEGVRTLKTADVRKNLKVDFTLHLSGTPFKAIADGEFTSDQIFNWSYSDEQEAKEVWDYEHGDNPYAVLPRMNFRAYHMSTMMESQVEDQEACFDLGEFFKASGNGFVRPGDVEKWLDKISGVKRDPETGAVTILPVDGKLNQPFDSEEKRNQLRHTFWFMSRINECRAMKELLNKHPIFKDYKVVLAAGKGDDEYEGKKVLEQVQNAIGEDPTTTKTITLSCGQLTTGITVRPWTAVFMLYGTTGTGSIIKSSSTQYLQAAFRAQNPWSYGEHQEFYKSDCYVFDFAPDRVLTILQDYAVNLSGSKKHEDHKPAIRKLLNYMSVISMDDAGELRELDAKGIVELPRKLIAKEIVDGGFVTSNKLFNINNIFHASPEARAIINKLQAVKKQKLEKNPQDLPEPQTKVGEDDNVIIDPEILVNTSNGILKEKSEKIVDLDARCIQIKAEGISDDIYAKFCRIVKNKNGLGITPIIQGQVCSGCHMILPMQFVNDVRLGTSATEYCPYCSRILYYQEDEEQIDLSDFESSEAGEDFFADAISDDDFDNV